MTNFLDFILNFGSTSCREERPLECDTYRTCEECIKVELEKHDAEVRAEAIDECLESIRRILHDKLHCFEDECDDSKSCDRCLYESIKKSLERIKEQNK